MLHLRAHVAEGARGPAGRVNAMLQRRLELLEQVATLAQQLEQSTDAGYTCETAGYFYLLHVLGRWERFEAAVASAPADDAGAVARLFPFTEFFADAPQPLFRGESTAADLEAARVCWRHLQTMFTELEVRHTLAPHSCADSPPLGDWLCQRCAARCCCRTLCGVLWRSGCPALVIGLLRRCAASIFYFASDSLLYKRGGGGARRCL